jgi:predicted O-linked N-acetylglucosamine transferase (SPINDLY family)
MPARILVQCCHKTVRAHESRDGHRLLCVERNPLQVAPPSDMTVTPNASASPVDAEESAAIAAAIAQADAAWAAGDRAAAISTLTTLAARAPTAAAVWSRLGGYALASGRADAALGYLQNAVARAPGDAAAWTNLGTALAHLSRANDAIDAYRRALSLAPDAVGARVNLGNVLERKGDVDDAVAELEVARRVAPDSMEVLNNLGNLYKDQGRFEDAFAAYDSARHALPDSPVAYSNLLALTKLSTRHTPSEVFALHRAYAERFEWLSAAGYVPTKRPPEPERRLRIGYVSPDCHTALPPFIEPVLRCHDRGRFDVHAYFNTAQSPAALARMGPITPRVMRGASDDEVAQWVRDDGIDILIDIAGHTGHNRLGVFGFKPAPVQITWLDYLNTTGLESMDYRLTDAVSDPPGGSDLLHSETLLRLAPTQWCWSPPDVEPTPGPLPALVSGIVTLGSYNNCSKLTDTTLELWAKVLAAVPSARLVVVGVASHFARTRIETALGGAARGRVQVLPRLALDAFRKVVAGTDIALDPFPFSGATTTFEALWQGLPVVTRTGATSASRSSTSILTALDLGAWIAGNDEEYIAIVERASRSLGALASLRSELPQRLQGSALCDPKRFAAGLEEVLRLAWRTWCGRHADAPRSGLPPATAPTVSEIYARRRVDLDARLAGLDAELRSGRGAEATANACELVDDQLEWVAAKRLYVQTMLAWAGSQPRLVERVFPPPPLPARRPRVSVLVCSIDPVRFGNVSASYRARLDGYEIDIIGVHDARSLSEGYNRAAAQAAGDILIFSHDDIELVTADFAPRLVAHLEAFDGVGIAGASRVTGPTWGHAGARAIHGHILHRAPAHRGGVLLMVAGFQHPVATGVRVLDGVFIAVRRHVWEATRFDADRYDGFHLYDLDFTWRASGTGARLAVPSDLLIFHASQGRYNDAWRRYARRFIDAAGLDPLAPPRPGGLHVRLETLEQVDLARAAMVHFRYGAPAAAGAGTTL